MVDKASVSNSTMGKSMVDGMDRGSVDSMGMNSVDRGSRNVATSRGRGVDRLTRVGNLSNVAGQVVGVVGDGLDSAVGKVDRVRSRNNTSAIVGLRLLEVGLGVVISHGIGVGVGGGLSKIGGSNGVHHRGVLG